VSEVVIKKGRISDGVVKALKGLAFPFFAIIVAIFVSVFFVMWAKGYPITDYFTALKDLFSIIWKGSFGSEKKSLNTLCFVTPLVFTGVANAVAFRTGLFNIGVEGQFIMGMIAAAVVGMIPGLSPFIHIPLVIICGMLAGGLWGAVPGYLKAKVGTNEVINTIMMNYVAMYFGNWIARKSVFAIKAKACTPEIQQSAQLFRFNAFSQANIGIFIAIACAIFIYWLLWKTTIGYEIRACGINASGAEYGGISKAKNIVLAMVISGSLAGIGGAVHVAGVQLNARLLMTFPGMGMNGIAVALLAKSNPIGCIATAVIFGALNSSSTALQLNSIPKEIVALIQAIVIIFVATDYVVKYFATKKKKGVMING